MTNRFEVCFTVWDDENWSSGQSNLSFLTTVIECFMPQQAQAMIEAQYGGRAQVHSVRQIN